LIFEVVCLSVVRKAISIGKTSITIGGIGGVGSSESIGESSLTPLPLSRGSSSGNSSKMSSLGLSNLRGINRSYGKLWVEGWGNKRLRVEGRCNTIIDGSNRETRVSNTESGSVSNVLNLLEFSVGVNIRVSSRNSSIGVSNLLLGRVDVSITVVQVAKLILSVELASSSVRSSSNHWSGSSNSWSSSVSDSGSSSNGRSSGISHRGSSGNNRSGGIGDSGSSGISHRGSSGNNRSRGIGDSGSSGISDSRKNSRGLNSLNLNLSRGSNSIRIASIAIGTSITKTSIRVASIGQGGGQDLGILSHAGSHQGGATKNFILLTVV